MASKLYMTGDVRALVPNIPEDLLIHLSAHPLAPANHVYEALARKGYPISFRDPLDDKGQPLPDPYRTRFCGVYLGDQAKKDEVTRILDGVPGTQPYDLFLAMYNGNYAAIESMRVDADLLHRAIVQAHLRQAERYHAMTEDYRNSRFGFILSSAELPRPEDEMLTAYRLASQFGVREPFVTPEMIDSHMQRLVDRLSKDLNV